MSSQYADSGVMYRLVLRLYHVMYSTSSSGDNLRSSMLQLNCALQLWCKEHEPTFQLGQQQEVKTVYNARISKSTQPFLLVSSWEEWRDVIVNFGDASLKSTELLERTNTTKAKSDYLWYTLRFVVTLSCTKPRLNAQSFVHVAHFMLGRIHAGAANGSSNVMYFTMAIPIELNDGMRVLVSNKTMGWNQYSKINSFL
ncbi:beta-galactosidase 6 [Quercus suber]|uniref:Beta-galactosidase 6 n=1 Tax=Quercus suber TaxID=58331 RepID=A0AAW0L8W0_QUESU